MKGRIYQLTKLVLVIILLLSYELGFLIVPVRLLILVMTSKSLNKKNPRSLRPACPDGIETKSNDINCLSLITRSEIPSIML